MEASKELRAAINHLYVTFALYPLRENTVACPCCHDERDEECVRSKPLRELQADDLWKFVMGAMLTWGDVDDFKHFLPRLCELMIDDEGPAISPEVVLGKLTTGEWWDWSDTEKAAVQSFLNALWDCAVNYGPEVFKFSTIDDWLCGVAQAVPSLKPYLDAWLMNDTENASLNLAKFITHSGFLTPAQSRGVYWEGRKELGDEVSEWVRSTAVKERMKKIVELYPDVDYVELAYTVLP